MGEVYRKTPEKIRRYQSAIITKTCVECGRSFEQRRTLLAVCSHECCAARQSRLRPQTFKDCSHCGQRFGPVDHLGRAFCSYGCKKAAQTGKPSALRGRRLPNRDRARTGECLTCGKQFRATKDHHRRKQLYCSHRCYLINRRVSGFEQRVGVLLASYGLALEPQKRIGRWTVDFAIVGTPLLVEADGSYWHASATAQERDSRKDADMRARGYELHRIDERVFMQDGDRAVSVIVNRWQAFTGQTAVRQ